MHSIVVSPIYVSFSFSVSHATFVALISLQVPLNAHYLKEASPYDPVYGIVLYLSGDNMSFMSSWLRS
jgi:hypothetical protein